MGNKPVYRQQRPKEPSKAGQRGEAALHPPPIDKPQRPIRLLITGCWPRGPLLTRLRLRRQPPSLQCNRIHPCRQPLLPPATLPPATLLPPSKTRARQNALSRRASHLLLYRDCSAPRRSCPGGREEREGGPLPPAWQTCPPGRKREGVGGPADLFTVVGIRKLPSRAGVPLKVRGAGGAGVESGGDTTVEGP